MTKCSEAMSGIEELSEYNLDVLFFEAIDLYSTLYSLYPLK